MAVRPVLHILVAVMLGVQLAGLGRVVSGVGGVAAGHVGVMARRLGVAGPVMAGRFAMMARGLLVMVGGVDMVVVRGVGRSHAASSGWRVGGLAAAKAALAP